MKPPFRVAVLTSGPSLGGGVREFLRLLEANPAIELAAVIWQTRDPSLRGVVTDLWRRRGWLAGALLVQKYLGALARFVRYPLQELALARTLRALRGRIHCFEDIHAPQALAALRAAGPVLALVYGAPIIRRELYTIPPLGTLGIHHGKVPEYRGKKTSFWAMYNGERTAGVTIQRINDALDGGDVVEAGEVEIGLRPHWRVWRELERLGFRLYLKAVLDVCHGRADFRPQQGAGVRPYRDPRPADIARGWLRYLRRLAGAVLPGRRALDG